jgi:hypothetical protein
VTIFASATDNQAVAGVRFTVDGQSIDVALTFPYSIIWDTRTVDNGTHVLGAVATDTAANTTTAATVTVDVQNGIIVERASGAR